MRKYVKTAYLASLEKTNNGLLYLFPYILIKIFTLIGLIFIWKVVMSSGVDVGMNMKQMLTYTYISALLADMLVVRTAASGWLSEGVLQKLYGHPLSVIGQLIAHTIGGWIPTLLLFSLPMILISSLLEVSLVPDSILFLPSLLLCITLGFAIDLLFACLSLKLKSMNWLISRIRMAIAAVLSGTIIPIRLLPFEMAEIMMYQPYASLGGAPLSIFVGTPDKSRIIALQLFWNIVLWPIALFIWNKSKEEMVSYGG